jgi:Fe-S-cluster-containing dehydrogenase component/DMSO reductase anchor subunit
MMTVDPPVKDETRTLVDALLAEQRDLTAVERFSQWHDTGQKSSASYRHLLPLTTPKSGEQYAFEVNLDQCSGCKACVTACHSLNGLEETETWRSVGLLVSQPSTLNHQLVFQQHVTTACHHCVDPACLNGCPVLAYDKDPQTGIVRHLDDQCIGCQYCVMKCPYEVPKYSSRLGIVRKCDMCSQRLAVGEAPACVQACPSEAIRITLVDTGDLNKQFCGTPSTRSARIENSFNNTNSFLSDSPTPHLTLPTTRYVSKQTPANLIAADHDALRLDQPHWPLVVMLVLTQSAVGLFLAVSLLTSTGFKNGQTQLSAVGFGFLIIGLTASVLHLGQPLKAWRSFLGWRKSWLSREIILFNLVAFTTFVSLLKPSWLPLAAAIGSLGVFASAMVYVDTGRPLWSPRFAFGNFFGTTLLLGATFAAVMLGWTGRLTGANLAAQTQLAALIATIIRTALFIWRRLELRIAARNPQSPIHFNARVIRELLTWTTPARTGLFAVSTLFGVMAIFNIAAAAPWWASIAALTTFSSEIVGRYIFFAASASKRMPGGVA